MSKANRVQVGGSHYKVKAIQPWDFIVANDIGFLDGNVIKYVSRYRSKGGLEDLKKARHYLDKLIEVETKKCSSRHRGVSAPSKATKRARSSITRRR